MNFEKRLIKAREHMQKKGIDALFLPPSGDLEYLTGIRRQRPSATDTHMAGDWLYGAYVTDEEILFVTPGMAETFIKDQIKDKPYITELMVMNQLHEEKYAQSIVSKLKLNSSNIAVSKKTMGKTLVKLKDLFPDINFRLTEDFIAKMRMIKDEDELKIMKKAALITDEVFKEVVKKLKFGMTEQEVAAEVDLQMLKKGAEGTSFITGVMAKGPTKSDKIEDITRTTGTKLERGCTLAFDFGVVYQGYVNDFGRMVYLGEPSELMRKVHKIIYDSQEVAMKAMLPGKITAEGLYDVAKNYIKEAGYGKEFWHRLGHGIGIDVHEYPLLDKGQTTVLQENMTFTIEPSILIPDQLWIRVEDVVVVTPKGGVKLNEATTEIIVLE